MNHEQIIRRLRTDVGAKDAAPIGIVATYAAKSEVDTTDGKRDIVQFVNTIDIDSDQEVVMPDGADWSYVLRNRQVFVDHKYGTDNAVGTMRALSPFPNVSTIDAWRARTFIYPKSGNRLGDDILTIAQHSGIGASVGFLATDYGPPTGEEAKRLSQKGVGVPRSVVRKWKAIEYSITAFPCNVACQGGIVGGSDFEKRAAVLDELVTKGMVRRLSAAMLGAPIAARRKFFPVTTNRKVRRVVIV